MTSQRAHELSRRGFLALSTATGVATFADPQAAAASSRPTVQAADLVVEEEAVSGGYGVVIRDGRGGTVLARQSAPAQILAKVGDAPVDTAAGYRSATRRGAGLVASGVVTTAAGSVYRFDDAWTVTGGAVLLDRTVTVQKAVATLEMGFNSRLAIGMPDTSELDDVDLFLPGVRYGDATGLPSGAIGSDPTDGYLYVREMRLALPFVVARDRTTGATIALSHDGARPATDNGEFIDERTNTWWINESIQYAALGAHRAPRAELAFTYPALEGEKSYLGSPWARRSHPVRAGFSHRYRARFTFGSYADLPAAAAATWRDHWDRFAPAAGPSPATAVFAAGVSLLGRLTKRYNGFPGLPFRCRLPSGEADAVSYVMGFIGQQAPAGYQMLRAGLMRGDAELAATGRSVIDFWVQESGLPNGLPKLWIDGDKPNWREWYPAYIRVASDGMDGVLDAARLMRRRGKPVAAWEAYLKRFGDFLVGHQNDDGSFYRAYNWNGTVNSDAKSNTSHPVRLLVNLTLLTKNERYLDAAVRAGRYYYETTHGTFHYQGGTADNPNVLDKEGGGMAMHAYLALHDATGEERWLDAARQAADYTETWLIGWGWQMDTPRRAYRDHGPLGLSLIASGHSGIDNWISYESANFYRLYLFTGDAHYRDVARFLLSTSFRTTQYVGNNVGYAVNGLVEEAVGLADLVVSGTGVWLPWCTVAQLEPLARLEDIFGSMDITAIERLPLAERKRRNREAGQIL
ncbi:hypothetical protein [Actinopolymorpha pittospori]|uniref:Uncharacterized protein n=1 Tax=Actinopolymorpha pittospori TaxID=648752 RepID=A0A927MZM7_9ACTN|nr:hypothetical protein [Actinopolymorpha pittospori]MBE1609905.1 hypothetical protein [Actinopolymorpha pittospori]